MSASPSVGQSILTTTSRLKSLTQVVLITSWTVWRCVSVGELKAEPDSEAVSVLQLLMLGTGDV